MVALVAKRFPRSDSRGVRVRVGFADTRGGAKSFGRDHGKHWIGNATFAVDAFVADHPIMRSWAFYLARQKRVFLVDAG